jgi:hypothetical protein
MRIKGFIPGCIAAIVISVLASATVADDDTADLKAQIKALSARVEKMEEEKFQVMHKEEMAKMMKEMLADAKMAPALPKWMENLKFYADFRLRYEYRTLHRANRRRSNQNRPRYRLRFGFTKTWWDKQLEVGFRLATNLNASDTSNVNFGGGFAKKNIGVDLMYAKYKPKWMKGLTFIAGKMKNPVRTKTLMTWDPDINPEGYALDYQMPFWGDFKPYAQFGYWIVQLDTQALTGAGGQVGSQRDCTMWSFSGGFDWKLQNDMEAFFGATYYLYENWNILSTGFDGQWLNAAGVSDTEFHVIELTGKFNWKMFGQPFGVWGSWVHNCTDTYSSHVNPGADYHFNNDNNAYGGGITVGQNKKSGDWSASLTYLYEEMNSIPDAGPGLGLSDATFNGPNRKGVIFGGKYNLDDFLTLGTKIYLTTPVHSLVNQDSGTDTTFFVDLVWVF